MNTLMKAAAAGRQIDRREALARLAGMGVAVAGSPILLRGGEAAGLELVLMTSGGSWKAAHEKVLNIPFTQKYGAGFVYDLRPNAERIPILYSQRAQPRVDLVDMQPVQVAKAESLDIFEPLDENKVPNLRHVPARFRTLPTLAVRNFGAWVLTYNTKRVNPADVRAKGWEALTLPAYRGRVAIPKFGWQGEMWLHGVNQALGGRPERIDPGIALARAVVKDNGGRVMETVDHGIQLWSSGEIWMAPFWNGRTLELVGKGHALAFEFVPGWVAAEFGFSLVKNASHRELALRWINWSLEPETMIEYARRFYYMPTHTQAKLPPDLKAAEISPEQLAKAAEIDYRQVAKYSDPYLERWNKEVLV